MLGRKSRVLTNFLYKLGGHCHTFQQENIPPGVEKRDREDPSSGQFFFRKEYASSKIRSIPSGLSH